MSKTVSYSKHNKINNLGALRRNVGSSRTGYYANMVDGDHFRELLLKENPNSKLAQSFWTVGKK